MGLEWGDDGSGYGTGGYGGGVLPPPPPPPLITDFDIFCFINDPTSMGLILAHPDVSTVDGGGQFNIDVGNSDLLINSGGGPFVTDDAQLNVTTTVPQSWSLEFTVVFDELPDNFSDLVNSHIGFFTTDAAGPCAGVFISKVGIAYAGGVHHDGSGNMVLDSSLEILAGSAGLIAEDEYITIRIAADLPTGAVYIFVSKSVDLPVTGLVLRYILPVITAADLAFPPTDRTLITVRGTAADPSFISLDTLCLGTGLVIPNFAPVADAGSDQAVRTCNIVKLDGSGSFDPEGVDLIYDWRLIDAPLSSSFAIEGSDGTTLTGPFVDKLYSPTLGTADATDPLLSGDVLVVGGLAYTIIATGTDGNGFFVMTASAVIPGDFTDVGFKFFRQRTLSTADEVCATFFPDIPGIYKFDLQVSDSVVLSKLSTTIVNVLETNVPKGCTPDLSFLFQYLSDFWGLVEDRERIEVFWQAMSQVAASELLTLWQIDYSKSLRDIQRSFQRRWLHYDLLLAEPIPELTQIRQIRGGVTTNVRFTVAGLSGIANTQLVLSSPLFATDQTIIFTSTDPVLVATFVAELQTKLQLVDSRFTVQFIEDTTDEGFVRIDAPFPFTVTNATTIPIFTVAATNNHPSGTVGIRLGIRTYKAEVSLEGLDIVEGDVLTIDGVGFLVSRVVDDASDTFRFQRMVVQRDLPTLPGSTWAVSGHVTSELVDFFNGLVSEDDQVTLEVTDTQATTGGVQLLSVDALSASQVNPSRLGVNLDSIDEFVSQPQRYTIFFAKVLRHRYIPLDDLVEDIPCLQEIIDLKDEEELIRRNVDYFIEEFRGRNAVRFVVPDEVETNDIWEGDDPPDRLWAETTFLNNNTLIEANFGIPAGFTLDDLGELTANVDYLSIVRGLWYAYLKGPAIQNMRVGTQILLGLPFAEESGTIEEIRTDFSPIQGRILVRDSANTEIVRSYEFPKILALEVNPATGVLYVEGDTVNQFAPLVEGAEIIDYIKDPTWFEGILNQGIFFEVEKFHKFLVRVDSAAFDLSTLLFVKDFILKVKPTYTFPLTIVLLEVGDTEVSVTDNLDYSGTLELTDTPCTGWLGSSTRFDDPRAGGGGYRNQFDSNADPDDASPTPVTPDTNILWGFDKNFLCPGDVLTASCCVTLAAPTVVTFDSCLGFDEAVDQRYTYQDSSPFTIVAGPAGTTLTPTSSTAALFTSNITAIQIIVQGLPGTAPPGYEVAIDVNAAEQSSTSFVKLEVGLEVTAVLAVAVVATDAITARIRPAVGGTITTVPVADLIDGETFTLDDGVNPATVFEFDVAGDGVGGGTAVDVSTDTTADEVRDRMITAINGVGGTLDMTAYDQGPGFIGLVHDNGSTGVVAAITEAVADGGFVVFGMSAGSFSPSWDELRVNVTQPDAAVWAFGDTLAAGTYCSENEISST